jgi:osmotically-inducible protein OsmY
MKTDIDIRRDVEAELQWEPRIDDREIHVAVNEGVVTLTGTVPHWEALHAMEAITKRVDGVRAIASEIVVRFPPSAMSDDVDIAKAALHALRRNITTRASAITPIVQDGWVVLTGHVAWGFQKTEAEHAVRHLPSVRGVSNDLVVASATEALRHHEALAPATTIS